MEELGEKTGHKRTEHEVRSVCSWKQSTQEPGGPAVGRGEGRQEEKKLLRHPGCVGQTRVYLHAVTAGASTRVHQKLLFPPCLPASLPPCLPASLPPCLRASLPPCLPPSLPPNSLPAYLTASLTGSLATCLAPR